MSVAESMVRTRSSGKVKLKKKDSSAKQLVDVYTTSDEEGSEGVGKVGKDPDSIKSAEASPAEKHKTTRTPTVRKLKLMKREKTSIQKPDAAGVVGEKIIVFGEVEEDNIDSNLDELRDVKGTAAGKNRMESKMIKFSIQEEDVKPFNGYKCYFEQLIVETNRVGSKMDSKTKQYMMETPFGVFFKAILDGKITKKMVQRCNRSVIDVIHMYSGKGLEFCFTEHGQTVELKGTTISCVFGIEMGEEHFNTHEKIFGKYGVFEEKYFKVPRVSRKELSCEMTKLIAKKNMKDDERVDLVKMLILYSFATFFFANTSDTVAKTIAKKFDDIAYVKKCCWPSLIHSYLMQSIQKNFKSNFPNVSGCVYILLYFFLEHTSIMKTIKGRESLEPRMARWDLGEVTGPKWTETIEKQKRKQAVECLIRFSETVKQMFGNSVLSPTEGDSQSEELFVKGNKIKEIHKEIPLQEDNVPEKVHNQNREIEETVLPDTDLPLPNEKETAQKEYMSDEVFCGLKKDMTAVDEHNKDGLIDQSDFGGGCESSEGHEVAGIEMVVEKEKRSKRFHEDRIQLLQQPTAVEDKPENSNDIDLNDSGDSRDDGAGKNENIQPDIRKDNRASESMLFKSELDNINSHWEGICAVLRKQNSLMEKQLRENTKHGEKERNISDKTIHQMKLGLTEITKNYELLNDIVLDLHQELGESTKKMQQMVNEMCRGKCDLADKMVVEASSQHDSVVKISVSNLPELRSSSCSGTSVADCPVSF